MTRRLVIRILQVALFVGVTVFVVIYLRDQWDAIRKEDYTVNMGAVILATLGFLGGLAVQPFASLILIRNFSDTCPTFDIWRSFFVGQVAKYLPGSLWSLPGRAYLYHRCGIAGDRAIEIVGWEAASVVLAASLISLLGLPLFIAEPAFLSVGGVLIGFALVYALIVVLIRKGWLHQFQARLPLPTRLKNLTPQLETGQLPAIILRFCVSWLVIGISFGVLVQAFDVALTLVEYLQLTGLFAASWAIGFLVFFTPGGIGVRDTILVLGLSQMMDDPLPLIITVAARICWTLADFGGFLIVSVIHLKKST